MKLTTNAKSLAAAVGAASKLETKSMLIDGCVRLRASRSELEVSGTSILDHYTEVVDAEVVESGAVLVSGAALRDALRGLSGDVSLSVGEDALSITHDRGSAELVTRPADDWPPVDEPALGEAWTLDGEMLATALRQIAPALSHDETRPQVCGIAILVDGSLAASDGHIMGKVDTGAKPPKYLVGTILPARAIASILAMADAGGEIAIARDAGGGRYVAITSGGRELRTAAPSNSPPPYQQIFDGIKGTRVVDVDRAQLLESLARIGAALGDACVVLRADGERLRLSAQAPAVGSMIETVDATGGDGAEVGLGVRYLRTLVAAGDGERVELRVDGALKPVEIRYPDVPGLGHVVMPRRI